MVESRVRMYVEGERGLQACLPLIQRRLEAVDLALRASIRVPDYG